MLNLDPIHLIQTAGLLGIFLMLFAETGLLVGFFLPGDTLLFAGGILAAQGYLDPLALFLVCSLAAILGDSMGYYIGKKAGPRLFSRETSFFFNKKNVERTEEFYKKYGILTILVARFVPIVRTFAPVMAGVGSMRYGIFISYNIFGGIFWAAAVLALGFFFGSLIPNIDKYILPILGGVVILSFIPAVVGALRARSAAKSDQQ